MRAERGWWGKGERGWWGKVYGCTGHLRSELSVRGSRSSCSANPKLHSASAETSGTLPRARIVGPFTMYGSRADSSPEATWEAERRVMEAVLEGDSRAQAAERPPPVMGTSRAAPSTHAKSGPLGSTGICDSVASSLRQGSVGGKDARSPRQSMVNGPLRPARVCSDT